MTQDIGETAGKVWHFLEEHPNATIEQIVKELSVKENLAAMAIGWLAREGKLAFADNGKKMKVSLAAQ